MDKNPSSKRYPLELKERAVAMVGELQGDPCQGLLVELLPYASRLDDEYKRLHDAIRTATWNAESALGRALVRHYRRAENEAHRLLAGTFKVLGDLEVISDELHMRLDPLSAPRRSRAIAALCSKLNETEMFYPGTKLRLV